MAQGTAHFVNRGPLTGTGSPYHFRLGEWKIGSLLTACFVAIVLLMIVGDVIAVLQLDRVETRAWHFYQADQKSLAIMHVYLDVVTFRETLTGLSHDQNPHEFASRATALRDSFLRDVAHAQEALSSTPDVSQDPTILIRLETVRAALPSQVDTLLELVKVEDWQAVRFRLAGQVPPLIGLCSSLVADVEQEVAQERARALESVQRTRRQLYLVLPITALLMLLMAAMLGWYATRRISRPLAQLDAGAQALARGEFGYEVELRGNDELADLARAFNYAAQQLQKLYDDIKRSEAYLAEAQRLTHTGSWAINVRTDEHFWSEEIFRIYEFDPVKLKPAWSLIRDRVHPDDRASLEQRKKMEFTQTGWTHSEADFRIVVSDGKIKHLHTIAHPVMDASGRIIEVIGTTMDVTERKRVEDSLRRSESYLAEAQKLTHTGSWAWRVADRKTVHLSEEFYRICGIDPAEGALTLEQCSERVHPEDRLKWKGIIERAIMEKSDYDREFRILLPNGTVKWIHTVGHPVLSEAGDLEQFVGSSADITERKHAEEALRSSEAYLVEAQSLTHTGSYAIDGTSRETVYWSDEMFRLFGFDPQQGLPMFDQWLQRIHPEDRDMVKLASERTFLTKVNCDVQFRIVQPDGTVKHIHGIGHPVLSATGELVQVLGTMVDVTERKRADEARDRLRQLEADLAHIDRVSTLGEMAASLAHEIKQPIAAAITSANSCMEWLAHEPPNLDRARAAAARIDKYGNRAAEIIDRIRSLYKKSPSQRELVDVNQVIHEMLTLLKGEADRCSVTMRTDLSAELPKIIVDRVQLQQVFMNLMLNAIEAMQDSGGKLMVKSQLEQDRQLLFSVSDTGSGLPAENVDKIFSAFFTTKSKGSGMGLAISRSIVESHGGRLWATANDRQGATFYFTLPTHVTESALVI